MRFTTKWCLAILAALFPLLAAESAWAWGPATHLHYGMSVLHQLSQLADPLRALLAAHSIPFLYGCVSADIVLAKKLGRAMTHCHRWDNGFVLIEKAPTPRTKAFSLGYVSHLAADTISHNCYVPSKTIESYDSGVLKHMYWELLFDKKLTTNKTLELFEEIAKGDFSDCDEHMESLVPTRLFDFSFNKQIFNQLLLLQGLHQWQKLWASLSRTAPWPLKNEEVEKYIGRAMEAVMSFLKDQRKSHMLEADPTGQHRLKAANDIRRHFKKQLSMNKPPSSRAVRAAAERFAREPFQAIDIKDIKSAA